MNAAPDFTINEAAKLCGVSRDTVKRRLRAGQFPGAVRCPAGIWRIPLVDLARSGLNPDPSRQGPGSSAAPPATSVRPGGDLETKALEIEALRAEVDRLRAAILQATTRADTLELALRLITGRAGVGSPGGAPSESQHDS